VSEWATAPKKLPRTGHIKATHRWCAPCQRLHRTHRHAEGEESCASRDAARDAHRTSLFAGPRIRKTPKGARLGQKFAGRGGPRWI